MYVRCFSRPTFPPNFGIFLFPSSFANFPSDFVNFTCFFTYFMCFSFPPTSTMMHLCSTQCTHWTPLDGIVLAVMVGVSASISFSTVNHRFRLWGAARARPKIIENCLCFHQLLSPFPPIFWFPYYRSEE